MSDQALQKYEPQPDSGIVLHQPLPPPSLFGVTDPVEVVAKATRVADALKAVVVSRGLVSKIQGKEYPLCEAWTLLGTMLGVFPVCVWTRPTENGWEARVEARTRDGSIVGAAEAQCLKTERNWGNRDDFALRSMAQTRATAKALRMPLGFVMTLSGFQPTPAEEMDFNAKPAKQVQERPRTSEKSKPAPTTPSVPATEEQRQRWLKLLKPLGQAALDHAYESGWLLPPSGPEHDCTPGEPLECLQLKDVPPTKRAADAILAAIQARTDGQKPAGASETPASAGPDETEAEIALQGGYGPQEGGSGEPSDPPDDVLSVTGKLEQVSMKEGRSKKGPWRRYGLKIGNLWLNTFNDNLGKCAQTDKGHAVKCCYREGERGADLVSIERARQD